MKFLCNHCLIIDHILLLNRWWTMYRIIGDSSSKFFEACNFIFVHLTPLKTVVLTWMMGLSIALPPLLGWAYYAPEPSGLRYLYLIYGISNTKW